VTGSTSTRPLPDPDDSVAAPHWQAAATGRVAVQRCGACAELRWPPAPICPECLTPGGTWTRLTGDGTVWSVAVYHRAFHPGLHDEVPYRVGLVELDEGPRLIARLAEDVGPGHRVRAGRNGATGLLRFECAEESAG
jgi:uncharacterized OB-fold protein